MSRSLLAVQLQDIVVQVVMLGNFVNQTLDQSLSAVKNYDAALCELVIASDEQIDALRTEIEQKTFRVLTLQQPLGGTDVRFLSSVPSIVRDLERIGENAAGIAKLLLRMAPLRGKARNVVGRETQTYRESKRVQHTSLMVTETAIIEGLLSLGKDAQQVLQATMKAFATKDPQAARHIWQEDDVVDVRYHMVRHEVMSLFSGEHALAVLERDGFILQRVTYWLWMAHNLERVGDHCTNICERIVFILRGDTTITPRHE